MFMKLNLMSKSEAMPKIQIQLKTIGKNEMKRNFYSTVKKKHGNKNRNACQNEEQIEIIFDVFNQALSNSRSINYEHIWF